MSPHIASMDLAHSVHAPVAAARRSASAAVPTDQPAERADQVELSAEALEAAGSDAGVRQELIDSIRALIASGQYETDDKIDAAADRLLRDLTA